MDKNDKQRIENAIWTLLQYDNEIREMSSDLRIDRYEIGEMFETLHLIYGKISE